ncbi:hypothetical protein [Planobispora takensis]|uniref:Uncharacterized protein n=1 Tax=Planobispora takensis TaxID=1367882 RepID=A0A8J3SU32_9ACTN|nr:hypothetical protein [Planobispora takensis]GIH99585.1 hypothetical protein Pta02_15940 [Planobispora takensis]
MAADVKRQVITQPRPLRFLKEDAANGDRRAADQVKIASAVHRMRTLGGRLDPHVGKISLMWGIGTDHRGVPVTVTTVWRTGPESLPGEASPPPGTAGM